MKRWFCVLGCGLVFACADNLDRTPAGRFNRPNRMALVCVLDEGLVKLSTCGAVDAGGNAEAERFALVTQSARGEVAAVNLETRTVIDARNDIPGFTYTDVGEIPVGIEVAPSCPKLTYVANLASNDIRVLDTATLLSLKQGTDALVQRVSLDIGEEGGAAGPVEMRMTPDERALVLAVPDRGQLLWVPLDREDGESCEEGGLIREDEIRVVSLADSASLVGEGEDHGPVYHEPYQRLCAYERTQPENAAPIVLDPEALALPPRPVALAIDAFCPDDGGECTHRLLVADESLPLIHALDMDALRTGEGDPLLTPIAVGVPTSDVVVTPFVPTVAPGQEPQDEAQDGEQPALTQFVYAIDANDGSVLVAENGQVLNVNSDPAKRSDRIPLEVGLSAGQPTAAALEIVTPAQSLLGGPGRYLSEPRESLGDVGASDLDEFDLRACADETYPEPTTAHLRGVFLAVATNEGAVRIVDIHDSRLEQCLEERCDTARQVPRIVRHHPRLAPELYSYDPVTTRPRVDQLSFLVDGLNYRVRDDGTSGSSNAPKLQCISCTAPLIQVAPDPERTQQLRERAAESADEDAGVPDSAPEQEESEPATLETEGAEDTEAVTTVVERADQGVSLCPEDNPALICSTDDPWIDVEEPWQVVYEGFVPGTQGGLGRFEFDGNTVRFRAEVDFCGAGVLGSQDFDHVGDQLLIRSDVLEDGILHELLPDCGGDDCLDGDLQALIDDCGQLREALADDEAPLVSLEILEAHASHLVVGDKLLSPVDDSRNLARILRCVAGQAVPGFRGLPLRYEVRLRESYAVVGTASGFLHSVVVDPSGDSDRCILPEERDPLLTARAYPGERFRNRTLEFEVQVPDPDNDRPIEPGVRVLLDLDSRAAKLTLDLTASPTGGGAVVPVFMRYSDLDRILYVVDIHSRGLIPISLNPFPSRASTSIH